jgi:hypothetical protein
MPRQDDGGVAQKLAAAKKVLTKANAFQSSVAAQTTQLTGHDIGVTFAQEHGKDHQGSAPVPIAAPSMFPQAQTNQEAESIRSGLAWRAQQIKENPELDYNK